MVDGVVGGSRVSFYVEGDSALDAYRQAFAHIAKAYDDWDFLTQLASVDLRTISSKRDELLDKFLAKSKRDKDGKLVGPPEYRLHQYPFYGAGLVTRPEPLWLASISAASPGSMDLVGVGATLEQIRLYLVDRAERKKDASFRDDAEQEELNLRNLLLRIEAAQKAVDLMQGLGLPENEIQEFVRGVLASGAQHLGQAQDLIGFGRELPVDEVEQPAIEAGGE